MKDSVANNRWRRISSKERSRPYGGGLHEPGPHKRERENQERETMEFEMIKKYLEKEGKEDEPTKIDKLPYKFFDPFIISGLRTDLIEPGRVICSFKVPPRLLNTANTLHGGAIASLVDLVGSAVVFTVGRESTGVSVEINVSYLDAGLLNEEIEIEAKALRVGKTIAVVSVELRKKASGKIIAQGRHTKYLPVTSKL